MIKNVDIVIVGAGPVGLMCAYLAKLNGLNVIAIDKTDAPLEVGRADALNARSLQLLELINLFDDLLSKGKVCKTSSIWSKGKFITRESSWWDELEGCLHKHFLMIGQSHIEKLLDNKLKDFENVVLRSKSVIDIEIDSDSCITSLLSGEQFKSKYVIGADGSRSFVREKFMIPFDILRPQITWAVVDGIIVSDFPKVPEIIVFQNETSDVAWIPREGSIDRFYVRMDKKDFLFDEVLKKINLAIAPHTLIFKEIVWYSQFSVKESVAKKFSVDNRIFLAGDSCHVHSVNGGQGLNTGLADAYNLIWKISAVINLNAPSNFLDSYEKERKPIAKSVIESSGELVRSTKYSDKGTHAKDYIEIVKKRSGNITGMGIRYGKDGLEGSRVFDFEFISKFLNTRLFTVLSYTKYNLLVVGECKILFDLPSFINFIQIDTRNIEIKSSSSICPYKDQIILIRPDSYIESIYSLKDENYNEALQYKLRDLFKVDSSLY